MKVGAACYRILARRLVTMTQFPRSDVGSQAKWPAMTRHPLMMSLSLKDSSLKTNQCGGPAPREPGEGSQRFGSTRRDGDVCLRPSVLKRSADTEEPTDNAAGEVPESTETAFTGGGVLSATSQGETDALISIFF